MTDIVDDVLSIAQHITQYLTESEAVSYMLAIEGITQDVLEASKLHLPVAFQSGRRTKEGHLIDICRYFADELPKPRYLLANLSLLPGFQIDAIKLAGFVSSTVRSLISHSSRMIENCHVNNQSEGNTAAPASPAVTSQQQQQSNQHAALSHTDYPSLPSNVLPQPISNWETQKKRPYLRQQRQNNNNKKKPERWTHGTSVTPNCQVNQQLKFICLGIRSGPAETVESVEEVLKKWTDIKDMKIDAVSRSDHRTMFRAQFMIPARLVATLQDNKSWPLRMSAAPWKGNPKKQLQPIETRIYKKKIYVGSQSEKMTQDKLKTNLKTMYADEIQAGQVEKIEVFLNEDGWKREQGMRLQNPHHVIRKSFCVIITSEPGKSLTELSLKENWFPTEMQRSVRLWSGQVPWPNNHPSKAQPPIELNWQ